MEGAAAPSAPHLNTLLTERRNFHIISQPHLPNSHRIRILAQSPWSNKRLFSSDDFIRFSTNSPSVLLKLQKTI